MGAIHVGDTLARAEPEEGFVDQLTMLSAMLAPDGSLDATLRRIADLAVSFVPGTDTCGVSVHEGERVVTRAATGPLASLVDEYQYQADEGPCLEAATTNQPVRVTSMQDERRWPRFTPKAAESGVVSILSLPLSTLHGDVMGALNLYSTSRPFREAEERAGGFGVLAGAAIQHADAADRARRLVDNLQQALESRDVIGQAKGIIMERERVTAEEAFDRLCNASQQQNIKLRELAERVVQTGTWES